MPHNRNNILCLAFVVVMFAMTACDRKTIYHGYDHADAVGWEKTDTLLYNTGKIGESGTFSEEISLRLNGTYPFVNLCMIVEQNLLPANIITFDTLNCKLASRQVFFNTNGVSYRHYNFHLKDIELNEGDTLLLRIRHNMMREVLPGIADVGVKISRN